MVSEFGELDRELRAIAVGSSDYVKVYSWKFHAKIIFQKKKILQMEEAIHAKFQKYQRDEHFINQRQKHTDLRAKLEVVRRRIGVWEKNFARNANS